LRSDPIYRAFLRDALLVYAAWTAATYLLEGLPGTLVRPEAVGLRLAYALVAGLGLGILLPLWRLRALVRAGAASPEDLGFGSARRAVQGVAIAAVAGCALFAINFDPPAPAVAVLNAFAQVWVVSVAEVLVCWGLVGSAVALALRARGRTAAAIGGALVASALFGLYHFAHSPPFNSWAMVGFLSGIGLATSAWWFISRDAYGTAIFHNFFAVTGVLAALRAAGLVPEHPAPETPLFGMAAVATIALVVPAIAWVRRAKPAQ